MSNLVVPVTTAELQIFVQKSHWRLAKSMPLIPHEYTLRSEAADEALFERVVVHIRKHGYRKVFQNRPYVYLDLGGWQYWTMGSPLE